MENIVLDELMLIADFLSEAPAICLDIFKGAGIKTMNLITFNESEFAAAISATSNTTFEVSQLWCWVTNWRERNNLVNASILPCETNDNVVLSTQTQNKKTSDLSLTANDFGKDSIAMNDARLEPYKSPVATTGTEDNFYMRSFLSQDESCDNSKTEETQTIHQADISDYFRTEQVEDVSECVEDNTNSNEQVEVRQNKLDIDYKKLGLGDPNEACKKWNSLFQPIAKYVAKHAKDPSSKELIRDIQDQQHSLGKTPSCS
ncbi:uncharacterized protein LOC131682942 [Topomyia yanbarensis]|uniref:uncharacterized protein LOC131682942 n=1 Tax=Topomyia yanbarensis TaxID=2498891 RepID=UPI00273BF600|nr:uncharacterized protein LOC131682942 [Topomyia yanbarensis]